MRNANEPAIDIVNLTLAYRTTPILRGLHLQVRRGEIYALLGGNGAGKSTTINALLGFARPTSGQVRVCGIDVAADLRAVRASLAYVPENVVLYEYLSARENLEYFLSLAGEAAGGGAIEQALDAVALDRAAWDRRLSAYSKGMRQKVAIALALAREVPLLLLDEPTSGLDPQATREFNALLQRLRAQGKAVFIVTHDLLSAAEVADRIGFLDGGVLAAEYAARGDRRFDVQELYRRYGAAKEAA
jgi:ABC-2 type transport system ATP-binding protein